VTEVNVVDDYTIDFLTSAPNPIFPGSIANFMIMDRDWTVENGAETPATDEERYTTLNTNGTGGLPDG
jgi:peptide/nickel transport system substrate-binding protein